MMSVTEVKAKVHYGNFSFHNTHQLHIAHTHKYFQASDKLQAELINNNCLLPAKSICRFYCDHCVLSNQMHHKIPDRLQRYICWYVWFGGWWPIKQPWQICASEQANRTWTMLMHNIMESSYFYFPALVSYRSWNAVIWMEQAGFVAVNLLLFSEGFSGFHTYTLCLGFTHLVLRIVSLLPLTWILIWRVCSSVAASQF